MVLSRVGETVYPVVRPTEGRVPRGETGDEHRMISTGARFVILAAIILCVQKVQEVQEVGVDLTRHGR